MIYCPAVDRYVTYLDCLDCDEGCSAYEDKKYIKEENMKKARKELLSEIKKGKKSY